MSADIIPLLPAVENVASVEYSLLSALLHLPDKLELIAESGISREDFQSPRANIVWFIACRLAQRRGEVTAITVLSLGCRAGMLTPRDSAWLLDIEATPSPTREQALQIAEDLRVQSRARQIRSQLMAQVDVIDRGRFHPAGASSALTAIVHSLATDFTADDTADADLLALNEKWDRNVKLGKESVDPTGIRLLDDIIGGAPENIWFIHGAPGVGKNMLLTSIIKAQLERDANDSEPSHTGVFLLEDGVEGLLKRWQAEGLGLRIRDIGSKVLTAEETERKTRLDERLFGLLRRVHAYRYDSITRAELHRRCMRMIYRDKVRRIFIDTMKEIDHSNPRQRQEQWQQIGETVRVVRNLARDSGVPIGIAIHDTEETHDGPPDPRKMSGGQAGGDKARLVLGVHRKRDSFRVTVTKGNELGPAGLYGPTVELRQNFDAGTVDPDGGRVIDLRAEEAREKRETATKKLHTSAELSIERKAIIAKRTAELEAEKPKADVKKEEAPAQGTLLNVPTGERNG